MVFKSAWIPAPPLESLPAIESTVFTFVPPALCASSAYRCVCFGLPVLLSALSRLPALLFVPVFSNLLINRQDLPIGAVHNLYIG